LKLRIPVIPVMRPALRVELTAREAGEMRAQRLMALHEIARLRKRQLEAVEREIERAEDEDRQADDIEREAIEDEGGGSFDEDLPDWESDEFSEEWGEDIDYELFTVLS